MQTASHSEIPSGTEASKAEVLDVHEPAQETWPDSVRRQGGDANMWPVHVHPLIQVSKPPCVQELSSLPCLQCTASQPSIPKGKLRNHNIDCHTALVPS